MGVPTNHPFVNGLSIIKQPFLDTPIDGKPHILPWFSKLNTQHFWALQFTPIEVALPMPPGGPRRPKDDSICIQAAT